MFILLVLVASLTCQFTLSSPSCDDACLIACANGEPSCASIWNAPTPPTFTSRFTLASGASFDVVVNTALAPPMASRFYVLSQLHYFEGAPFYRVLRNEASSFVAQVGYRGSLAGAVDNAWLKHRMSNETVQVRGRGNVRGTVAFGTGSIKGPRENCTASECSLGFSVELFVNTVDNSKRLDASDFSPFATINAVGMGVIDNLYAGYGELSDLCANGDRDSYCYPSTSGGGGWAGVNLTEFINKGLPYTQKNFPKLDRVKSVTVIEATAAARWGPDSNVFSDHMVLASSDKWSGGVTPARVWGIADANEVITVTGLPSGAIVSPSNPFSADATGNFSITIAAASSLTPVNLVFIGSSSKHVSNISDVLFGHTILCSGQSNMDMAVYCSFTYNETFRHAVNYPEIRGMMNGASGSWSSFATLSTTEEDSFVEQFSAACYYTAWHLKTSIPAFKSVPIGLVKSSIGGQVIERFLSIEALEAVGVPTVNATGLSCGQESHTLYDELIAPLAPFVFKTMLWWQGEANVGCNAATTGYTSGYYSKLLPKLVATWRQLFNVDFVALVVQLAAYSDTSRGDTDASPLSRTLDPLPLLREAQMSVYDFPPSGVVHLIDTADIGANVPLWTPPSCSRHGGIHPRNKTEAGRRLAFQLALLEGVLPVGFIADGPKIESATQSGTTVTLSLDATTSVGVALVETPDCALYGKVQPGACCQSTTSGNVSYPFEFRLADNATYVIARAMLVGSDSLSLTPLDTTIQGPFTGIRYAWMGVPLCSVSNAGYLPMAPFRMNL